MIVTPWVEHFARRRGASCLVWCAHCHFSVHWLSALALCDDYLCRFFSAHGAAWERWKATNLLESCSRSQSHASGKERYSAGSMTKGMLGGAPGRIGEGGAAAGPHRTP